MLMYWRLLSLVKRAQLGVCVVAGLLISPNPSEAVDPRFDVISDAQYERLGHILFGHPSAPSQKWGEKSSANKFTNCTNLSFENLHAGVDYAAPLGTPFFSATAGEVKDVIPGRDCQDLNCTSYVRILHQPTGRIHVYLHSIPEVSKGQKVIPGITRIGTVNQRGPATGPHVHFQVNPGRGSTTCIDGTFNPYDDVFFRLIVGDINGDAIVNSLDWSIMNAYWLTDHPLVDLNNDGLVNSLDFSLLNTNWMRTVP